MVSFNDKIEEIQPSYHFYEDEINNIWYSNKDYQYYRKDYIIDNFGLYNFILKFTSNINENIIKAINTTNITPIKLRLLLITEYGSDYSFDIIVSSYFLLTDEELFD
jgi:hypothetical protein